MRLGRNGVITATFPKKCEMRLPLWSWRPLRPRWSYTSANAELALNGLLRFGTALCTSVLPRGLFSSNTSHFVTRRVTPPRAPASSRPTRSHPRPPRARATRHNAVLGAAPKSRPRPAFARRRGGRTHPPRRRPPRGRQLDAVGARTHICRSLDLRAHAATPRSLLLGRSRTTHFTRFLQKPPSNEKSCLFSGAALELKINVCTSRPSSPGP